MNNKNQESRIALLVGNGLEQLSLLYLTYFSNNPQNVTTGSVTALPKLLLPLSGFSHIFVQISSAQVTWASLFITFL